MQDRLDAAEIDGLLRRAFPAMRESWPRRDELGEVSFPDAWTEADRRDWRYAAAALEPWPSSQPLVFETFRPPRVRRRVKLISPIVVALVGAGAGALTVAHQVW